MRFTPKKIKYKTFFKSRSFVFKKFDNYVNTLKFGDCGIKSLESGIICEKHLETLRLYLRRSLKKGSLIWFRVFPNKGGSKKPIEVRMGKGKGGHAYWYFPVKKGRIIFEVCGKNQKRISNILKECIKRMPFKCKIIKLNI